MLEVSFGEKKNENHDRNIVTISQKPSQPQPQNYIITKKGKKRENHFVAFMDVFLPLRQ